MTDDGRLRSALTELAEGEPIASVPIDLGALERARRNRWLISAAMSVAVVAGAATLVVQTGALGTGGGETGTGVEVVDQPGDDALPQIATVRCTDCGHRRRADADRGLRGRCPPRGRERDQR